MAYNKQVVWPKPFGSGVMPIGKYSVVYTVVVADIPLYEYSREVWDISDKFPGSISNTGKIVLSTSTSYESGTLKVYADGMEIEATDVRGLGTKGVFSVDAGAIAGKSLYCEYTPSSVDDYLGDQRDKLRAIYQVEAGIRTTTKMREIVEYARKYIDSMAAALQVESPLWKGGVGNQSIGAYNNIIPGLTPTSVEAHLVPIRDAIVNFTRILEGRGYSGVIAMPDAEYSIEFFNAMEQAITEIDAGLEVILN